MKKRSSIYTSAQVVKDTLLASQYFKKADSLLIENRYNSSIALFEKAKMLYESNKVWEKVASSYNKVSHIQKLKSDFDSSLKSANQVIEISNQYLKKNNKEEAHAYDNIGHYYEQSESDFKTASVYFNKAFEIRKEIFPENHEDIALSYDKIGVLYHRQGLLIMALDIYKKCFII